MLADMIRMIFNFSRYLLFNHFYHTKNDAFYTMLPTAFNGGDTLSDVHIM